MRIERPRLVAKEAEHMALYLQAMTGLGFDIDKDGEEFDGLVGDEVAKILPQKANALLNNNATGKGSPVLLGQFFSPLLTQSLDHAALLLFANGIARSCGLSSSAGRDFLEEFKGEGVYWHSDAVTAQLNITLKGKVSVKFNTGEQFYVQTPENERRLLERPFFIYVEGGSKKAFSPFTTIGGEKYVFNWCSISCLQSEMGSIVLIDEDKVKQAGETVSEVKRAYMNFRARIIMDEDMGVPAATVLAKKGDMIFWSQGAHDNVDYAGVLHCTNVVEASALNEERLSYGFFFDPPEHELQRFSDSRAQEINERIYARMRELGGAELGR